MPQHYYVGIITGLTLWVIPTFKNNNLANSAFGRDLPFAHLYLIIYRPALHDPLQTLESFRKQLLVSVSVTSMKRFLSTAYPLKAVNSSLESKTEMIQSISVFWELSDFADPQYQAVFHIAWHHHQQMKSK